MAKTPSTQYKQTLTQTVLLVFSVAFVARLIFLWQYSSVVLFETHIMDMAYHHAWAQAIADGRSFVDGPYFRAPLYPWVLGVIYTLLGDGPWAARVIQILMGSLSAVLVFLLGNRIFSRRTGLIAGLGMALYGPIIWFDGQLLVTTLALFLNLASLYLIVPSFSKPSTKKLAAGGLLLGLSAIARPTILLFSFLLGLYLLFRFLKRRKVSLAQVAVYAVAVILPILPVTIHNYAASGEFTLVGTYSGMNLYIGNHRNADGVTAEMPEARHSWWGMMEDSKQMAEAAAGHSLSDAEQSSYWTGRALDEIAAGPFGWLGRLGRKALLLCWGEELSNNVELYFFAHKTTALKLLLWKVGIRFPWGVVLPLAVLGFAIVWQRRPEFTVLMLYIIGVAIPLLLFFVTARYRVPLVPVLLLFASAAVARLPAVWQKIGRRRKTIALALTAAAIVLANFNLLGYRTDLGAHGYHTMATIYDEAGDPTRAEQYYRRALVVDPDLPESLNDFAMLLAYQGRFDEAIPLLERRLTDDPDDRIGRFNLASFYAEIGQIERATEQFRAIVEDWPEELEAWNKLGNLYFKQQDYVTARECFVRTVELDSSYIDGYFNAGIASFHLGDLDSATASFEQTLERDPLKAVASYYLGLIAIRRDQPQEAIQRLEDFMSAWMGEVQVADEVEALLDSLRRK